MAVLLGIGWWRLCGGWDAKEDYEISTGRDCRIGTNRRSGRNNCGVVRPERRIFRNPSGRNQPWICDGGDREYRGFVIDNVFHSVSEGDIHYNVYIRTAMTAANHMRFILPCRDMRGCIFREFPPISSRKNLDLKLRDIMKK